MAIDPFGFRIVPAGELSIGAGRPHAATHSSECKAVYVPAPNDKNPNRELLAGWICTSNCAWQQHNKEIRRIAQRRYMQKHRSEVSDHRVQIREQKQIAEGHNIGFGIFHIDPYDPTSELIGCHRRPLGHPDRLYLIDGKRHMQWVCDPLCVCEECIVSLHDKVRPGYDASRYVEALRIISYAQSNPLRAAVLRFWTTEAVTKWLPQGFWEAQKDEFSLEISTLNDWITTKNEGK